MAENNALNSMMEQWFETQKKMFDFWQTGMGLKEKKEEKNMSGNPFVEIGMKPIQDLMKKWVEYSEDFVGKSFMPYSQNYPYALMSKMLSSTTTYQNLMKFWEDLNASITGKDSDISKFYSKWNENYAKLLTSNFVPYLPEQMQIFFKDPLDIYKSFTHSNQKFFAPWLENAREMQNLLVKCVGGDQEAYIEFSRIWNESFSSSYGKLLSIPQFSMNRDNIHKFKQGLNTWISFITIMNEFIATLTKANRETFEEILKEYQEMAAKGNNPKTFKEFYEYWWRKNEKAYMALFSTDEFSKLFAKTLDAGVNFKRDFDDLMEEQLKFLPYPSRSDMDSVYQTISDLKREMRTMKKEVAVLKETMKSVK